MRERDGVVVPGFDAVAAAFERNFDELGEIGAAVAVYHGGRLVVDLAGGSDPVRDRAFTRESLMMVASCTKGATAACVLMLADEGVLDVDEPVATYWPEFGQAGKGDVPLRWVLSHQAGLPYPDPDAGLSGLSGLDQLAGPALVRRLERQAPWWPPGSAFAYHPITSGTMLGEVVRRVTGRTIGQWFAEHVAAPLGLEFWIGLPPALDDRVAPSVWATGRDAVSDEHATTDAPEPGSYAARRRAAMERLPPMDPDPHDAGSRRAYYGLEVPAAHGIANARSLARLYAALLGHVDGVQLLSPAMLAAATTPRPMASPRSSRAGPPAPTSASGSATSSPRPACRVSAPRRSGTPAPAGASASPTRTSTSRSATSATACATSAPAAIPAGPPCSPPSGAASDRPAGPGGRPPVGSAARCPPGPSPRSPTCSPRAGASRRTCARPPCTTTARWTSWSGRPSSSSTRTISRPAPSRSAAASTWSRSCPRTSARRGLIAASTGNHGQSVAYAARRFGVTARICVPDGANPVKTAAIAGLGAELVVGGADFDAARERAEALAAEHGYRYVHSGDEPHLIAGVATETLEILEERPDVEVVIVPVGGGSGAAGACIAAKAVDAAIRVIGVQSEAAPAAYRSWRERREVRVPIRTTAEGLATGVPFGLPQRILRDHLDDFVLVSDERIRAAQRHMIEATRNLVEAAGAAPLAAALELAPQLRGRRVALVASGGNVTREQLLEVLGVVGRRARPGCSSPVSRSVPAWARASGPGGP